jgi:hypothetical protein
VNANQLFKWRREISIWTEGSGLFIAGASVRTAGRSQACTTIDDPTEKGKAAATRADADGLERLFRDLLGQQPHVSHEGGRALQLLPLLLIMLPLQLWRVSREALSSTWPQISPPT